jgi:multidrug resistance protein, MATE family
MTRSFSVYRREISETISLSLPIVIAQLGVILMGVTDNIMVGRFLGATALGAAGLANSLSFLVSSIGVGGLGVVASLISQAKGQENTADIARIFKAGLRVALILGVVLGVISAIIGHYFELFGQTAEITALSKPFMYILSVSIVPLFLFIATRQLSDGLSKTQVAMFITVSALGVNWLFNYLLINGIWIFPEMGLNGSATATLIARFFMATAILTYVYKSGQFDHYLQKFATIDLQPLVQKILRMAIPTGFQFFFEIAAFSLAVVMIGWLGENQLAAHQIAINLASTTYMMATGIAAAGAIRVGRAFGQQDKVAVFRAGTAVLLLVVAFMGLCCLLFLTSNNFLVTLYLENNPPVMQIAAGLVIIAGFFQLSDGVQVVALGALRGLNDINVPTLITLVAYWVLALPLSYVLGFTFKMDVTGVWIALSAGLTFSAVFLTVRFYWLLKKLDMSNSTPPKQEMLMH